MKISRLRTHLVHCAIPEERRVRSGAGLKLARQAAIIEIETDAGLSGIGPCSFGSASLDLGSVASLVEHVFAPMLIGEDAAHIERLWERIYYGVILRVFGPRSMGLAILSGIDIALWDLKGKALGAPIYQLLGGSVHDRVFAYGSSIYWSRPDEAAAQARAFVAEGFRAVKLKIGLDVHNDLQSLAAIREAVGPDIDVMVDANMCYASDLALRVGRELEKYGVLFFEEPISIDDVEGHRKLAQNLDLRIATGENLYTRFGFLPFIRAEAIDVVQPDASRTGGISEAKKIVELAGAFHLHAAPHTFSDILTVAANLHVAAVTPNTMLLELDRTYNPLMTELCTEQLLVRDSYIELPRKPGLGFQLNYDFIHAHPYHGEPAISMGGKPAAGLAHELLPDRQARGLAVTTSLDDDREKR